MQDQLISGTYRLVRRLGAGGMGEVWEAHHERLNARVAVKILALGAVGASGEADELRREAYERLRREAMITSQLTHPNIVRVTDFDRLPDGQPFLVMELLQGQSLHDLLNEEGPLDPERAARIVEQIAAGLAAAHAAGVVHRDLKPANVFVTRPEGLDAELVKVLDFGISKLSGAFADVALTRTRAVVGTPHYIAPEQARSGSKDPKPAADQFALAAIAYELLTRTRAFPGDEVMEVLSRVLMEQPPRLATLGLPAALDDVVFRGLSKAPEERFPSVVAFARAFTAAARGEATAGAPATPSRQTTVLAPSDPPAAPAPAPTPGVSTRLLSSTSGTLPGGVERTGQGDLAAPRSRRPLVIGGLGAAAAVALVVGVVTRRERPPAASVPVASTSTAPLPAPRPAAPPPATAPSPPAAAPSPPAAAPSAPPVPNPPSASVAASPKAPGAAPRSPASAEPKAPARAATPPAPSPAPARPKAGPARNEEL